GGHAPAPSLLVVQAPVFHSHAVSLNIQFDDPTDAAQVSAALAGEHVALIGSDEDAPNNVNAAGQSDVLVAVMPDSSDSNSVWVWVASDNLRVAASTAVECAEEMDATRPGGQVQGAASCWCWWFSSARDAVITRQAKPICLVPVFEVLPCPPL